MEVPVAATEHIAPQEQRAYTVVMASSWFPAVVSMTAHATEPSSRCDWHAHEWDEVCLVVDSPTTIGHAGVAGPARSGTCYLFRHGERHGYWNTARQAPVLWVVHYRPDPELVTLFPRLGAAPERRILTLDAARCSQYQALFLRLLAEHDGGHPGGPAAAAAWLRLLLVTLTRWQDGDTAPPPVPVEDPEVLDLWHHLNRNVAQADTVVRELARSFPNYDALRHRFRKAFKVSPREMITRLRIGRAKQLLLESNAPVAAISNRLGYARQHEFARAFHREAGCSPTDFRKRPR